jgi:hypothetical protein
MKSIKTFANNLWHDPVWSNLIANGITALAAWLFYRFSSPPSPGSGNELPSTELLSIQPIFRKIQEAARDR